MVSDESNWYKGRISDKHSELVQGFRTWLLAVGTSIIFVSFIFLLILYSDKRNASPQCYEDCNFCMKFFFGFLEQVLLCRGGNLQFQFRGFLRVLLEILHCTYLWSILKSVHIVCSICDILQSILLSLLLVLYSLGNIGIYFWRDGDKHYDTDVDGVRWIELVQGTNLG